MYLLKKYQMPLRLSIKIIFCLLFFFSHENCPFAAQQSASIRGQDSLITPPTLSQIPSCPFNFEDTYYNTDSGTNPPAAAFIPYSRNTYIGTFGATVQLQFNNHGNSYPASQYTVGYGSPTQYTPKVPCNGHYEISFSVELRNDSGLNCNNGNNSMTIWATTTDPASPNAYGCPISYFDSNHHPESSFNPSYTATILACATFSQWVQCAWTNNFNGDISYDFGAYDTQAFPVYLYTPTWNYQSDSTIYSQYPGMCYSWGCYETPGQFLQSYQTAFCSSKTFHFKNVVYLHQGAQISAPAMASQIIFTPFQPDTAPGQAACGFSVVGGKFKATYLGP